MKLLISQKDTIYDLIESAGLSPSQFELIEIKSEISPGEIASKLVFKNSDYFFAFENHPNTFMVFYSVFCPGGSEYVVHLNSSTWQRQQASVRQWLSNLLREIHTPNKWERLSQEIAEISVNFIDGEGKFSVREFEELQQKISALQEKINELGLLPEQLSAISNKLDHLTDLAKDMNKFDWKSLFIGTLVSIIIQLTITPENARSLWELVKQIFENALLP